MNNSNTQILYHASLFRRLAALVYDGLIIIAILFLGSAIAMVVVSLIMGAESITQEQILVENPIYFGWLMFCWFYYYSWCWQKSGQTLGMKAWRLKLVSEDDEDVSYSNAMIRFFTAAFGLANFWVLMPGKRGWHDILSHSNVVLLNKKS